MRRFPPPRGFSLVELMIVLAIAGILAASAGAAVMYGTRRVRLGNLAFETAALFSAAQMRASATGLPQYVAVWERNGAAGAVLFELPTLAVPDWRAQDWSNPASFSAQRLERVDMKLNDAANAFVPLSSATAQVITAPATTLPQPFHAVPVSTTGTSGLGLACSFCQSLTSGTGFVGVMRFTPSGVAQVLTPTSVTGGAALALGTQQGSTQSSKLIAVAVPAGVVRVF